MNIDEENEKIIKTFEESICSTSFWQKTVHTITTAIKKKTKLATIIYNVKNLKLSCIADGGGYKMVHLLEKQFASFLKG